MSLVDEITVCFKMLASCAVARAGQELRRFVSPNPVIPRVGEVVSFSKDASLPESFEYRPGFFVEQVEQHHHLKRPFLGRGAVNTVTVTVWLKWGVR